MSGEDKYKGMPKQVRLQAEASDKLMEEWKKRDEEAALALENDYSEPVIPPDPLTAEAPKAGEDPIPEGGDNKDDAGFDWKAEADAMREERDKAAASYSTLKGKYDAEMPRLQGEVRQLKETLDTLKAAPVADPETPAPQVMPKGVDLEQLRADYGDGIVDAMIAMQGQKAAVAPAAAAADPDVTKRLETLENQGNLDAEDAMFDAIEKEHGDWEAVDKLATWHKFLAEVDPNTGEPRQAALNRAQQRLDPNPIIRQLSAFKRRTKKGDTRLESQVVPGDDGRTEGQPTADTNVYRATAVDEFYKKQAQRVAAGKLVTEEHNRLDALYTRAMYEGRVR